MGVIKNLCLEKCDKVLAGIFLSHSHRAKYFQKFWKPVDLR